MKTLHLFMKPVGTGINLRTNVDGNVLTYAAVLERNPGGPVRTWLPAELETTGGSDVLGAAQGHVIVLPSITPPATFHTTLTFSDGEVRNDTVTVNDNEPFGWRIFMT
jgi:hypothetical protein